MDNALAANEGATEPGMEISRRDRRKLETRARIENAAYEVFKRHGIRDTSIEMVCQEANVARRTFYGHYPDKHALLGALGISRVHSQTEPMLQAAMEQYGTTRERIAGMIDHIEASFANYDDIDRQLLVAAPTIVLDNPEQQRLISHSTITAFAHLIEAGREAGETGTRFSPELLAEMIAGTLSTLIVSWAVDPAFPIIDKLEEARELFQVMVCGE